MGPTARMEALQVAPGVRQVSCRLTLSADFTFWPPVIGHERPHLINDLHDTLR